MDKFKKYAEILKNFSKDMEMWKACEEDEIADAKEKYTSMTEQAYIGLLEAEFRSCPVSREQIERAFEVAISEVKSSELSYGNLSTLLCQVFRNRSSQPCLSDAAQEQIRAILNVK